jgi:hypothetical protein
MEGGGRTAAHASEASLPVISPLMFIARRGLSPPSIGFSPRQLPGSGRRPVLSVPFLSKILTSFQKS